MGMNRIKYLKQTIVFCLGMSGVFPQDLIPGQCELEPSAYEFSMNIISSVSINGSLTNDSNNLLGAFVDDECRGVVTPLNFSGYDIFFLVIYSNSISDVVSFGFYHALAGMNITMDEQVNFSPNLLLGSVVEPYILHSTTPVMGDLNSDGAVDILDVILLVAIILGQVSGTEYQNIVGDTNGDLVLDVIDIVTIVGWIMN